MKPYRACSCRDPRSKRLLGKKCPDLGKKGHGGWYARYEAPRNADGKRRQPRIGPYSTERECKVELARVLGQAGTATKALDERKTTLGEYLERRHAWRESEVKTGALKKTTVDSDREAIGLYLKPGLGHFKVADLSDQPIRDLYAAMRLLNRPEEKEQPSELLRRLQEARATRDGKRIHSRPISESRIRRVHAVLTGALNDAVKVSKIRTDNPAEGALRTKKGGTKRKARIKPLLWTPERVERWEQTGHVPAKVMVWTSAQCGAFLDFAEASEERLYPLFHLDAYWGPRRGELVGLETSDLSIESRRLHVRQSQAEDELDDTKTESGDRQITLDHETAKVLKAWRKRQLEERLHWGEAYQDSGRVFTYEDGAALKPPYVSQRFKLLVERYGKLRQRHSEGWTVERIARQHQTTLEAVHVALTMPLPPIRFHDLRHGAATMLIAAGVDDKLVSEALGHASVSFTKDVYAVVAEELAEDAARKISAFIPRQKRSAAGGAITAPSGRES
ncbi:site-specific integrase [Streptomyces sp. 110]|uniref:Site-specific integrase n=1 Tax=Streptomyces endocoffeicus TaxID=2898945 RepID=A0ABS1Q792_9ACTN|nr:site-specific integrase [Streptomyces endocoffeicus]MBL1120529.1 site-specific integrase [Streptomyces endocoffeicus]